MTPLKMTAVLLLAISCTREQPKAADEPVSCKGGYHLKTLVTDSGKRDYCEPIPEPALDPCDDPYAKPAWDGTRAVDRVCDAIIERVLAGKSDSFPAHCQDSARTYDDRMRARRDNAQRFEWQREVCDRNTEAAVRKRFESCQEQVMACHERGLAPHMCESDECAVIYADSDGVFECPGCRRHIELKHFGRHSCTAEREWMRLGAIVLGRRCLPSEGCGTNPG